MHYKCVSILIKKTTEYVNWFNSLNGKPKAQIEKRLLAVAGQDYFGNLKSLGDGLWELKFNNGNRVYFARTGIGEITLLYGGNKNGQSKDIAKAKGLLG